MPVRFLFITTMILIGLVFCFGYINESNAQSKYSPFYINKTEIEEKNTIKYKTFSSPQYGFSIDYLEGATIEDNLDVDKAYQMYMGVEGPEIIFRTSDLGPFGVQFSSFNIYLNDSKNMDRYIYRDLYGSLSGRGTDYETKVIDSGSPTTVAGLPGKIIKFKPGVLDLIKEAVYFNDGVNTYHIEYTDQEQYFRDEIFDHIVNSFKFIPIIADENNEEADQSESEDKENNDEESDSKSSNHDDEDDNDNNRTNDSEDEKGDN